MKGVLICGGKGERLFKSQNILINIFCQFITSQCFSIHYPFLYSGCKEIFIVGNKEDFTLKNL